MDAKAHSIKLMRYKMLTNKIIAIIKIIRAEHVLLHTKRGDKPVSPFGFGNGDLSTLMSLAIELKKSYENILKGVNTAAIDTGELHALEALRKTVDTEIENGRQ